MKTNDKNEMIGENTDKDFLEIEEDPIMERIVLIFLILFFIALLVIPSDWFLKLSMWWNGIP